MWYSLFVKLNDPTQTLGRFIYFGKWTNYFGQWTHFDYQTWNKTDAWLNYYNRLMCLMIDRCMRVCAFSYYYLYLVQEYVRLIDDVAFNWSEWRKWFLYSIYFYSIAMIWDEVLVVIFMSCVLLSCQRTCTRYPLFCFCHGIAVLLMQNIQIRIYQSLLLRICEK